MISLTIDRTSLALAPLVITGDPAGPRWLNPDVKRPAFDYRRGYAPPSAWMPGQTLTSAVLDASEVPATIYHRADTTAALKALEDETTAALGQWSYGLTLVVDGVTVFDGLAEIAAPSWTLDEGLAQAHMSTAAVVIPVNPGA